MLGRTTTKDGFVIEAFETMYVDYGLRISRQGVDLFYSPHCLSRDSWGSKPAERFADDWYAAERAALDGDKDAFVLWSPADWHDRLVSEADAFIEAYLPENDDDEQVTETCRYRNEWYDPKEWLDEAETQPNPHYDPNKYHEIDKPVVYVTVYSVERVYLGPEEGGCYGDAYQMECSIPMLEPGNPAEVKHLTALLRARFPDRGSYTSVRPGEKYLIYAEAEQGSHQYYPSRSYE